MAPMRACAFNRAVLLVALGLPCAAQEILVEQGAPPASEGVSRFFIPFPMSGEAEDFGLGAFYAVTGSIQPQLTLFGSLAATTNGSAGLILGAHDYHVQKSERTYLDAFLQLGHYENLQAYTGDNPAFPDEDAGSNESDPDDYISDRANEIWFELPLNYLLPIAMGEQAIHTYTMDRGILVDGSTRTGRWNPLSSGRSTLAITPFWRRLEFDEAPERGLISTNGLAFSATYDNTDFNRNPSRGGRQELVFRHDPGWFDSTGSWSTIELDAAKYFFLSPTEFQRQRVLAFDFWTADTPTWSEAADGSVSNRPPYFEGATLGGPQRMRAYPAYRFNDKSAIYYSLEYRVIPSWHPLRRVNALERFDLDWWQWVAFAEVGRVSDSWNLETLHSDMKYDAGLSLRLMAHKQVVRFDVAFSPEGWALVFGIGQP